FTSLIGSTYGLGKRLFPQAMGGRVKKTYASPIRSLRPSRMAFLNSPELCRECPYFFRELAEFLLKINLTLVGGPAHMDGHPVSRGDDLRPEPTMVNERGKGNAHDNHRGTGPDDIDTGVLGNLQPRILFRLVPDQFKLI